MCGVDGEPAHGAADWAVDWAVDDLAAFLGENAPFNALEKADLQRIAEAARVVDYPPGAEIQDAFETVGDDLSVVLSGQVELWTTEGTEGEPADEVLSRGCVFGHSSVLTGTAMGPRAAALGPVRLVRIPHDAVAWVFSSPAGVQLLVRDLSDLSAAGRWSTPRFHTVDELVVAAPVLGEPGMTVGEAARLMTERSSSYLAVPVDAGGFGLVTDAVLREHVVAAGRGLDTPVREVMIQNAVTARVGTPTGDVLAELTERRLDHLLVTDAHGALRGAVEPQDFLVSPAAAGVLLREQVHRAENLDQVAALGRRLPALLADLVRQRRRPASTFTALYSAVVDEIQRHVLWKWVLRERPDLDEAEVTWLSLGSNARREPLLSSDIDSAVVFAESVDTPDRAAAYRSAFVRVGGDAAL